MIHEVRATGTGLFKAVLRLEGVHLARQRVQPALVLRLGLCVGADDGRTGGTILRHRRAGSSPQRSHGKLAATKLGQEILEFSIHMTWNSLGLWAVNPCLVVETPGKHDETWIQRLE